MKIPSSTTSAHQSHLRFVNGHDPGISRINRGRGVAYVGPDGRAVKSGAVLERVEALVIPPAWTDVWICTDPNGHLQATGVDERGRRQYRYHARWTAQRNLTKFAGLGMFAGTLPGLRRRVITDLKLPGVPREKVLACVVHLLDLAHIRIGNEEYARDNGSYGLTTIHNHHALVRHADIRFHFRAKSGKECDVHVQDPASAAIVRRCQHLPGQELFKYLDEDGRARDVTSCDVNGYLHGVTGVEITAKDFRTWAGTTVASQTLLVEFDRPSPGRPLPPREHKHRELIAIRAASMALYNTVATCRKFYVHPGLMTAYARGHLGQAHDRAQTTPTPRALSTIERTVALFLKHAPRAHVEDPIKT